jgi:hypothetical protein
MVLFHWRCRSGPSLAAAAGPQDFLNLGPLGAALPPSEEKKQRVLLVGEIDKRNIDWPNDLLHVFEEGVSKSTRWCACRKSRNSKPHKFRSMAAGRGPVPRGVVPYPAFPLVPAALRVLERGGAAFLRRHSHKRRTLVSLS